MPAITINKRNSIAGEFNNRQWPQLLTINRRESDLIPIRLLLIQNILYFNLIWSRWPLLSATNRSKTSKCRAVSFIGSSQGLRCTPTIKVRLLMAAFLSLFLSLSLCFSLFLVLVIPSHFIPIRLFISVFIVAPFNRSIHFWISNVPLSLRMSNNDPHLKKERKKERNHGCLIAI